MDASPNCYHQISKTEMRLKTSKTSNYNSKNKSSKKTEQIIAENGSDMDTDRELLPTLQQQIPPPKSNNLYVLTLYHTTNTLLIQGNQRANLVDEEYPLLKMVLNKRKEQESSMLDAYNHILETPILTANKELNQDPNITTSINEENPGKIPTMIPQVIITPPLEIITTEDNTHIPQSSPNPITLEESNLTTNNENRNSHTATKINQNNAIVPEKSNAEKEIILIEMIDKSTN